MAISTQLGQIELVYHKRPFIKCVFVALGGLFSDRKTDMLSVWDS